MIMSRFGCTLVSFLVNVVVVADCRAINSSIHQRNVFHDALNYHESDVNDIEFNNKTQSAMPGYGAPVETAPTNVYPPPYGAIPQQVPTGGYQPSNIPPPPDGARPPQVPSGGYQPSNIPPPPDGARPPQVLPGGYPPSNIPPPPDDSQLTVPLNKQGLPLSSDNKQPPIAAPLPLDTNRPPYSYRAGGSYQPSSTAEPNIYSHAVTPRKTAFGWEPTPPPTVNMSVAISNNSLPHSIPTDPLGGLPPLPNTYPSAPPNVPPVVGCPTQLNGLRQPAASNSQQGQTTQLNSYGLTNPQNGYNPTNPTNTYLQNGSPAAPGYIPPVAPPNLPPPANIPLPGGYGPSGIPPDHYGPPSNLSVPPLPDYQLAPPKKNKSMKSSKAHKNTEVHTKPHKNTEVHTIPDPGIAQKVGSDTLGNDGLLSNETVKPTNGFQEVPRPGGHGPLGHIKSVSPIGVKPDDLSSLDQIMQINHVSDAENAPVTQNEEETDELFEGDVVKTVHLVDIVNEMKDMENKGMQAFDAMGGGQWPRAIVPYTFAPGFTGVSVVNAAINHLKEHTCVRFIPKRPQDRDYILFMHGGGCSSAIGRQGGRQRISLARRGCLVPGISLHEMMHALGFFHEQSRRDRDKYIEIVKKNINPRMGYNFDAYKSGIASTFDEPYDLHSVMHYGNFAFSVNGKKTIVSKHDPGDVIGQRKGLSKIDVKQINKFYGCPNQKAEKKQTRNTFGDKFLFCRDLGRWCTREGFVAKNCEKTCCTDKKQRCRLWAQQGFCKKNGYIRSMKRNCPRSCRHC